MIDPSHLAQAALDSALVPFFCISPEGRVLHVNNAGCRMLGYSAGELRRMSVPDFDTNWTAEYWRTEGWEALKRGSLARFDSQLRRKDGSLFPVEVLASYVQIQGEEILFAFPIDISDRMRAEGVLRESEARYRAIVEDQTEFVVRWLPDGTRTFVNDSYCRYFEQSRERLVGTSFFPLIAPEDLAKVRERLAALTPAAPVSTDEHRVVNPDGTIGWQSWTDRALFDAEGRLVELQSVGRDVTARRRAEEELRRALSQLARLKEQAEAENVYLREEVRKSQGFEGIVGESNSLLEMLRKVEQVARTDAGVLILGETGTGKELIARAVHSRSSRSQRVFVKVDCSSLSATLIESTLFGHEKGAFTGAAARTIGRFELANEGTVFLDEIGELPLESQAKLLRLLQDGEFERLGSHTTIRTNVRIIAATNRDLEKEVSAGSFRSDLYYRLSTFPIRIPPLRARREDIPLLVWHYLSSSAEHLRKRVESVPRGVMKALTAYDWPGNVRELQNVIERAVILSPGTTLQLDDSMLGAPARSAAPQAVERLEEVERAHIMGVIEASGWKIRGRGNAADRLGMNPSTLRSRMKKLGIVRQGH